MMPLTMLSIGDSETIKRVSGKDETRRFLASLGFVEGEEVRVVSKMAGNIILAVKDSRIALDQDMAKRIMV
ncbi:MAG: ferrous iron transport protein A [Clostridiales bacterium]|nr:ferrous iron transport protein A [Clostridiales bacterium]